MGQSVGKRQLEVVLAFVARLITSDTPAAPRLAAYPVNLPGPSLASWWSALVLLPVVVGLGLLAGVGTFSAHRISHMDLTTLVQAVLLVGGATVAALVSAAIRAPSQARTSWVALAVAAAAWAMSLLGALLSWSTILVWGVLRTTAMSAAIVGLLAAPGVRRTAHRWRLLLLDGWLVGASVLLIGWVALRLSGSPLDDANLLPLAWVPIDLILASLAVGLAGRSPGQVRQPVTLLVLATLLTVTSDSTWALTSKPQFAVIEWLIMLWSLGSTALSRRLDIWVVEHETPARADGHPRITRLSQIALVPGLLCAAVPGADVVTFVAASGLVLGVATELLLVQRQHRELWRTLDLQTRRLVQLFQESRDAIVQVDPRGRVEFANDAVADVLGYAPSALLGRNGLVLVHPQDRRPLAAGLAEIRPTDPGGGLITARLRHVDGTWRYMESTVSPRTSEAGYTLSVRDISERNRHEAELRKLASTDALTGLLNRRAFLTLLADSVRHDTVNVLFIDLDGFKAVNDGSGHEAGDRVLCQVADVLRTELRPGEVAARLGGDEFAVLTSAPHDRATVLARDIANSFPMVLPGLAAPVGASIGTAAGKHLSAEALLHRADTAMYRAKAEGGGQVCEYTDLLDEDPDHRAPGSGVEPQLEPVERPQPQAPSSL